MNMRSAFFLSVASVAVVACGGSSSPTPPVSSAVTSADDGAKTSGAGTTANTVTGTIAALTGACPVVTFTLEQKTIKTSATTSYGDGKCADLKNGLKVGVAGTAQADGSILATKVVVVPPPPPPLVNVTGTISGFTGSCPAVTFMLEQKTIKTSATTSYGDRKCADLKNGLKVGVAGTAQADGSILAIKVQIVPPPVSAAVPAITGAITALTGTCPALTITVGAKTATTTIATVFDGRGCGDLKVGTEVAIFGTVPSASNTVVASKVTSHK